MSAILLTPPAQEPLSLADAKAFLRVAHDDDDGVITSLIAAARGHVEAQARCLLINQTWRYVCDAWPQSGRITPRMGPLQSLVAARVYDANGESRLLDAGLFVIDRAAGAVSAPMWSLPQPGRAHGGVELDLLYGFGAAPANVPELLRHAVRMLVSHWYDNRGLIAIGQSVAMMPSTVTAMIASYRVRSL